MVLKLDVAVQTDLSEMLWTSSSSSSSSSGSTSRCSSEQDLLAAWEDLLRWSENAAAARKLQEEMIQLKHALLRLGNKTSFELLDTEPSIQLAIEALETDKSQLQQYRTNMLHLNASVHGWLTRQERKLQTALESEQQQQQQQQVELTAAVVQTATTTTTTTTMTTTTKTMKQDETAHSGEESEQPQIEATTTSTTSITVTDSNGDHVESVSSHPLQPPATPTTSAAAASNMKHCGTSTTTTTAGGGDKSSSWDLNSLMSSEQEFHKHLKDEVSDMYTAWDEADARINSQLEVLTTSLVAWRQLESGLFEFQQALGQDRGTLKGLEGALDKGQTTPVELAQNVKFMAKLLSEKVNVSQEQLTAVQEHLDPKHILQIAKFTASTGSLSDSGISDGGTTSDGGLSERERRLGVLRRLAKQLESALAPGSDAMKSIAARMESAEAELKNLQNTCRDLIVRTAATHQNKKQQQLEAQQRKEAAEAAAAAVAAAAAASSLPGNGYLKANGHAKQGANGSYTNNNNKQRSPSASPSKRRNNNNKQRKQRKNGSADDAVDATGNGLEESRAAGGHLVAEISGAALRAAGSGDPDEPPSDFTLDSSDEDGDAGAAGDRPKRGWAWRIVRAAVPLQLALFTFLAAATLMQPNCCDNLNNLSMSFTPQLRYIRGPPPI